MKIIYCGDIVARPGREAVLRELPNMRDLYRPDVIIVNAENAAHGFGLTPGICRDLLEKGADFIVTGNHVWNQREIIPFLNDSKQIIRPLNYPADLPGKGFGEIELPSGKKIVITQVLGRLFMEAVDCPARALDQLLNQYKLGGNAAAIFVDVHAEITAEKLTLGHYLDGRVSAVIGSHTHVPTADARLLEKGTAYMTDVGMCGDYNSVIGFEKEEPINRLNRRYTGGRLVPAKGSGTVCGVLIETDDHNGLAKKILPFQLPILNQPKND